MKKDLSQDWLNWIFENVQKGCDKNELLSTLLHEGFDIIQCKVALGLDLTKEDIIQEPIQDDRVNTHLGNELISGEPLRNVSAEFYEIDNFLSISECEQLIKEIGTKLRPSTIANAGKHDDSYRTSSTCDLGNIDNNFLKDIDRRICDFIGISAGYGETLQGQHYLVDQEFKSHTDYFEKTQLLEHDRGRGQRTYTFMIYLNNVLEGGETEFPKLNKVFSPVQGKALIWNNLNEDGSPNENTIHQAHPVKKGSKTIITKWFRETSLSTETSQAFNKHIKTYTKEGFKKSSLDKELLGKIKEFYKNNKDRMKDEFVSGNFIHSNLKEVPSTLLELNDDLKKEIHEALKKPLETWSGSSLKPTFVYGIRDYKKGAVLVPHRDRENTHIISAIINVDKDLDEDWPLMIEDHFYRKHLIYLEPGEVVFYEGARLLHGRPIPLKGRSFANIFCHFTPIN